MQWLDKIKGIFKEERVVESKKPESISFEDIYSKVEDKVKENSIREDNLKKQISDRINQFDYELNRALESLEKIDLSGRKEHEKIKLVVTENLNLYISQLKRLIYNLKNIEYIKTKDSINKIFSIWNEFNRMSQMPFEKATILIGKELGSAREILKNFASDINAIAERCKSFFDEEESTLKLNRILNEITQFMTQEKDIADHIENINQEVIKTKESNASIEKKIQEIKSSSSYEEDLKKNEEHLRKLSFLENEIHSIKQKMDLKNLAKQFHSDKRKSQIIHNYSSGFKSALEADSELKILDLLEYDQNFDSNQLKELRLKIVELNKPFITESWKEISHLENELKRSKLNHEKLSENVESETIKNKKLAVKIENAKSEAKEIVRLLFPSLEIQ